MWFFCEPAFLVLASLAEAPRARPQKPIRTDRIPRGFDIGGVVTCRDCEKISQAPAPSCNCQGWAGPSLLAMILFEKCGHHQPLNRQSKRYAREGVPLGLSTLADQVAGCCAALAPLLRRVERHVFAAERLHSDDMTVPVLAKGNTDTGRCWVYVRDDRPFAGQ